MSERLIRIDEVAARVGWCPSQIYKLVRQGKFPKFLKHGTTTVWLESEIDAYVQAVVAKSRQVA